MTTSPVRGIRLSIALVLGLSGLAAGQSSDPMDVGPAVDWSADAEVPFLAQPAHGCGKACAYRALHDAGFQPGRLALRSTLGPRPPAVSAPDPTDVLNNNLSIEVNPPSAAITGTNVMTIKSNVDGLTGFTFRLRSNFTVTGCTVTDTIGSYAATPSTPPADNTSYGRTVTFSRPINAGVVFTVSVSYTGTAVSRGFGSFFNGTINGYNQVASLSEPYYAATWWPAKDGDVSVSGDNSDKATLDIWITAPSLYKSTANGILVGSDTPQAGKTRYHYASSYPISTYLVCFSTSQYNSWTANYNYGTGTMPVEFNINPGDDTTSHRNSWNNVVNMLAAYRPVYGLYPFINEKYGIYQFGFGGGMEHQTNTGQGVSGATPFDEGISSHELGHQWWGDNVTCKTWNDIWLNEGFATYTEAIWIEAKAATATQKLAALRQAMQNRKPSDPTNSVWVPDSGVSSNNRIFDSNSSYDKGAWVLHMLRHIVGEAGFVNTLAAYRAAFQGSAASSSDFIGVVNSVSGQDLGWFFTPWLYGAGAPTYVLTYQPATIDGRSYVRVRAQQTQAASSATFDMPLDLDLVTTGGTVRTTIRDRVRDSYFLLPVATPLQAISTPMVLDPDGWVLQYNSTVVAGAVQGPPKVVSIAPAPGSSATVAATPAQVRVAFSDNVTAAATDFGVTVTNGSGTTPVPFTVSYDGTALAATLTLTSPLVPGTYSVAVADTVTVAGSPLLKLDGELASNSAAALPSGDGVAGGIAAFAFTVTANLCAGDFNGSGTATVQDIFDFLAAYFAGSASADFNSSGTTTVQDIFDFLAAWFAGCR